MSLPSRFADTHLHLWDLTTDLDYSWLKESDDGPLGKISEIRFDDWSPRRFDDDVRFSPPSFTVHVQATNIPTPSWDETAWLVGQRSSAGTPDAIVCRVDLRSTGLEAEIAANLDSGAGLVRGVRDMTSMGTLGDPSLVSGLVRVAEAGLSWEASCDVSELSLLRSLADRLPELTIVLGHNAWPSSRESDYHRRWLQGMKILAEAPNVVCKVSAPGMFDHLWSVDSWKPFVHGSLEAFGADRCMFGSNWPMERAYAAYETQLRVYSDILDGLSSAESDDFWFATAIRTYCNSTDNEGNDA
ncbi:UNVERIFIED_ORG: putative TIM-barrel fold metal-dependent hydrolase [Paenarthrobacter nicotinovorans]